MPPFEDPKWSYAEQRLADRVRTGQLPTLAYEEPNERRSPREVVGGREPGAAQRPPCRVRSRAEASHLPLVPPFDRPIPEGHARGAYTQPRNGDG
jgi:hypothetical protein